MKLLRFTVLLLFFTINILFADYPKSTDAKNLYFSSEHFRVIVGISYENSVSIALTATKFLDSAENSWNKEVVELGFSQPRNSENKLIDIYLGNKSAYDYENSIYVTISSSYAGYAWYYISDRTPYFVMNPSISDDIIKVTISHEFFHTIQYAYFIDDNIPEAKWTKNIWWLEATAVLMEDEVYDDINDYVNFLPPFFSASYKNFEIYDGSHEYAMLIFAKYVRERYGMQIIKDSFGEIETSNDKGYFEILDELLARDYNSSMKIALSEFAKWVKNTKDYFQEGMSYPQLTHFKPIDNTLFGKGGVEAVDNLSVGWNMVALADGNMSDLNISDLVILWTYENRTWKNNIQNQINELSSSQGYWAKVSKESSINYTYLNRSDNNISKLNQGWSLLGTTKTLTMSSLQNGEDVVVWQYVDNGWLVYSNNNFLTQKIEELNYPILNKLLPFSSYWVYKL